MKENPSSTSTLQEFIYTTRKNCFEKIAEVIRYIKTFSPKIGIGEIVILDIKGPIEGNLSCLRLTSKGFLVDYLEHEHPEITCPILGDTVLTAKNPKMKYKVPVSDDTDFTTYLKGIDPLLLLDSLIAKVEYLEKI